MPEEPMAVYRGAMDAFNRRDIDWILDRLARDFEYRTAEVVPDTDASYVGREGWRRFWNHFVEGTWSEGRIDVHRAEDLGEGRVLGLITFEGVGRGSGADFKIPYGHICTVRDGLAVRLEGFAAWNDALSAAGLDS
jgi:ketosteroid isomerase-like protein